MRERKQPKPQRARVWWQLNRRATVRLVSYAAALFLVVQVCRSFSMRLDDEPEQAVQPAVRVATPKRAPEEARPRSILRTGVAIVDMNGFHDEVHGAFLWALQQFELDGGHLKFYRRPWRYDFAQVVSPFWSEAPLSPDNFLDDMRKDTSIRHVILTTCDWDWEKMEEELLQIWDERSADTKFHVHCVRHWVHGHITKMLGAMAFRQESLSFLTLGDHVSQLVSEDIQDFAEDMRDEDEKDERLAFSRTPAETFIPYFPAQPHVEDDDEIFVPLDPAGSTIEMAIIQSTHWDAKHRDMPVLYEDLLRNLVDDAGSWGYAPPTKAVPYYTPLSGASTPPFRLYLLGATWPHIPNSLQKVVQARMGWSYPKFYKAMSSSDIVIPAFGTEGYDVNRASSTMGVAMSGSASLLVSKRYSEAYGYFCPDFGIVRANELSEMDFIREVRTGLRKWDSRSKRRAKLTACQAAWTQRNVDLLNRLFNRL